LTGESAEFFVGLSAYASGYAIKFTPCSGMIQRIATGQKYFGKLLIVVGHHRWTRGFFGCDQEIVDIFHRTEGLLPEFELHGGIELRKASVEVMLKSIGILEVDRVRLVRVLCDISEVKA
jgi:hypothetical protein